MNKMRYLSINLSIYVCVCVRVCADMNRVVYNCIYIYRDR